MTIPPTADSPTLTTFKSGATGNVIMNSARAEQLLEIIGKPVASRGIVAAAALPQAILALERAVAAEETADVPADPELVSLRQRAWPLVDMFKRASAAEAAVVWGS